MTPLSPIDRWPRRMWLAGLLTLLMPGLGHIYCGRVRRGLAVWFGLLAAWVLGGLAWAHWLFVPVGPLIVAAGVFVALQVVLWSDLAAFIDRYGAGYQLRPVNHGLSYLAIWLGLGVLPLAVLGVVVERFMVSSVVVADEAMFPSLLPGDRVLFERGAFADHPPRPGELVVVARAPEGPQVARVVAAGGETVHLRDARPIIDGVEPLHEPVESLRVARFGPDEQARLDALKGFVERRADGAYVVTYDRASRRAGPDPAPASLAPDEIFVLGDNRDEAVSHHVFGRVPLRAVQGRPRYIWVSVDEQGLRPGRVGLEVE